MKALGIVAVCVLWGCSGENEDWKQASATHSCDETQWDYVVYESGFCNETTTYDPDYCLGSAVARNCTKDFP